MLGVRERRPQPKRRKKQPKRRRMNASAGVLPRLLVPNNTAKAAQRRRRKQRRGRYQAPLMTLKRIVTSARWISFGLLALTLYAVGVIGTSPEFYLTRIPVEGVFSITPEEIVTSSGLAGKHIFAADPNAAATAIAETPGIISASVTLEWPNIVGISIVEDSPIAIWEQSGEAFWINREGDLIPARINVPGLIRIQSDTPNVVLGLEMIEPEATEAAAVSEAAFGDVEPEEVADTESVDEAPARRVLGRVPDDILAGAFLLHELRPDTQTYFYHPSNGLSYDDLRGWRAYFGTGTDMEQKLAVYEATVAALTEQNLTPQYVSVSNQNKPFYLASPAQ